jgi:hypothetical protein
MGVKFTNNAYTTLASTISAGATSFDLASAATFPTLAAGDWTYVSLTDEVVKVTAISGVTCTCDAVSGGHSSGIPIELRMTAELLNAFAEDLEAGYKGGDIASASPTVIDTDGDYFDVTGTTSFAAFTVAANRHFTLQFDGALTMTHHATNLDLPGEANITTAAGDVAEFFSTGANTVQCVNYTRADGTAVAGSTNATTVAAAGALMDSELADIAAVKATTGTFLTADQTKLDAIEASATADQTASEIKTLLEDGVDSVHYVNGSIDTAHIATNQIDETLIKDAFVADFTEVTVATGDSILLGDADDSGNTKRDTVQGVLDLVHGATAGISTIWIPANAMKETASNGCAGIANVETTAGRPDMNVLDFDASADEHAQFQIAFPKSWNAGTVTFQVYWCCTAADTDGVSWGLQGVSVPDNSTIDVVYGTAVVVDDANQGAAEEQLVTAVSGALTISNAADDCLTYFRIFRDVSDANDTATEDARLLGCKIFFTTDAENDD